MEWAIRILEYQLDLVVNTLTRKAAEGQSLTVFGGEQWRLLLHVKDVAKAIVFCLEKAIYGLFNCLYDNYKMNEMAEMIKRGIPNDTIQTTDISF